MAHEFGTPGRWRIVVGDDDAALLATTTRILREAGHIVYATYNGFSTWQAATLVAQLDLLITNTRLADLNAPELIRRVWQQKPHLPVLHIGDPLSHDPSLATVPSLQEPFTPERLLQAVEALLSGRA